VEPHVLRFWESEFPQVRPDRAQSKQRLYTRRHLELFLEIKHLLYDDLYTIAGAKKQLAAQSTTESTPSSILREVKSGLLEIKRILESKY
jgi:DNA-binding transcriptional MerR regulator